MSGFDPFSGGSNNFGSHVVFAPIPIPNDPGPAPWQPPPQAPQAPPTPSKPSVQAEDRPAPSTENQEAHANAARDRAMQELESVAFTALMLDLLFPSGTSASAVIARKLPGSPENVKGQMDAITEDYQRFSDRQETARKMAQKDDELLYRS